MQSPSVSALMFIVSVMHGMQLTQQFYLLFHIVVKSFLIKAVYVHLLYFLFCNYIVTTATTNCTLQCN